MESTLPKVQTVDPSEEMVSIDECMIDDRLQDLLSFSVRCLQRNVIRAYYMICDDCGAKENICCKCGESQDTPIE